MRGSFYRMYVVRLWLNMHGSSPYLICVIVSVRSIQPSVLIIVLRVRALLLRSLRFIIANYLYCIGNRFSSLLNIAYIEMPFFPLDVSSSPRVVDTQELCRLSCRRAVCSCLKLRPCPEMECAHVFRSDSCCSDRIAQQQCRRLVSICNIHAKLKLF